MYFYTDNDSQLQQLVGESSYAVTFPKGQLPPVKSLQHNPDGSLTIYLGTNSPGTEKESNWLPAPAGNYSIWLRAYWPDQAILDGTWKPPAIKKAK